MKKSKDKKISSLGKNLIKSAEEMLAHIRGDEWTKDFPTYDSTNNLQIKESDKKQK